MIKSLLPLQFILVFMLMSGCSVWTSPKPDEKPSHPAGTTNLTRFGMPSDVLFEAPPTFKDLAVPLAIEAPTDPQDERARLRFKSMREAATSWGSQAGFHRRTWELQLMLTEREEVLDTIFDFNRVAWPTPNGTGMIVPPVIQRSGSVWTGGEGGQTASAAEAFFEIRTPGRIAPTLPGWRDYLVLVPDPPKPVVEALRPYEEEAPKWREWAAEGWNAGLEQADMTFEAAMARLERDYQGMLEYRRLLAQNMVSELVLDSASYQLGAEEDGLVMRVGERSIRIADPARFIGDSSIWRPRIVTSDPH